MTITLPAKTDFETTPAGTHLATCYRVVDLGTQLVEFKGETKRQHKIMLSWELPEEKMADDRPFSIHKKYTLSSSNKATLRKDLESWRGVPFSDEDFGKFDIGKLLGVCCLIGIVHTTKGDQTYANISSIMKLPKNSASPSLVNEPVYFSLSNFNSEIYASLSENLRATIAKSPEYQKLMGFHNPDPNVDEMDHMPPADLPDDQTIPF